MLSNAAKETASVRETLGDSDVCHIFLHDTVLFKQDSKETYTPPGMEKRMERALLVARKQDLVCLTGSLPGPYLAFLAGLGVGPGPENIIQIEDPRSPGADISFATLLISQPGKLDEICGKIPPASRPVLHPYMASPDVFLLGSILQKKLARKVSVSAGDEEIVFQCVQKDWIKKTAKDLGIPVAKGEVVHVDWTEKGIPLNLGRIKEAIHRQFKINSAVIIKSAAGALASPAIQVRDGSKNLENALAQVRQMPQTPKFLVEVMYDVTVSPNILMFVEPGKGGIQCLGITDQRLNENLMHRGNVYPSCARTLDGMLESAYRLSSWAQAKGFHGIVGYDFCEYRNNEDGGWAYFLAEMNPRINGSTYPLSLFANLREYPCAGKSKMQAFLSAKQLEIRSQRYSAFKRKFGRFFYGPGRPSGMVPYSIGGLAGGTVDIVVVGASPQQVQRLFEKIRSGFVSR